MNLARLRTYSSSRIGRAKSICASNSSIISYISTRTLALETRVPPTNPVYPISRRLVTILIWISPAEW